MNIINLFVVLIVAMAVGIATVLTMITGLPYILFGVVITLLGALISSGIFKS